VLHSGSVLTGTAYTPARPAPSYRARCGRASKPPPWPESRCASLAGQTQPVRPPCTRPDSPPGVTLLVRGESLAASMSDYLITQLKATPSIGVRFPHPSCRRPRPRPPGSPDARGRPDRPGLTGPAAAVFVMIAAEPRTMAPRPRQAEPSWIHPDRPRPFPGRAWPLPRPPLPFKTSLPGDQDAGRPDPGNLCAASRAGQSDRLQLGRQVRRRSGCAASSRCAGVQVRSRFRNLRGSAAGLPLG